LEFRRVLFRSPPSIGALRAVGLSARRPPPPSIGALRAVGLPARRPPPPSIGALRAVGLSARRPPPLPLTGGAAPPWLHREWAGVRRGRGSAGRGLGRVPSTPDRTSDGRPSRPAHSTSACTARAPSAMARAT